MRIAPLLVALVTLSTFAQTVTVHPKEDADAVLHNPGMGWVLYENYPVDADPHGASTLLPFPNETFPQADEVAVMFSWADVDKGSDRYDFSKVDYAYDYWAKRGKAIQLRMSADTLLWWNTRNPPAGVGVPEYVLAKLPADKKQVRTCEGVPYTVVDAREPYYLERLAKFLDAVERHYDKSRPVTLIDLRGFGLWGEWHTGYKYPDVEARHAALVGVLDCWSKHLRDHRLALSASYDPDSPKSYWSGPTKAFDEKFTSTYRDYLHFSAFDHALTLANVTFRRDGVGGAVHSNERKLIDEAFALGRGPMMSEFLGGYGAGKKGGKAWVDWMIDDALSIHPNYVALLGWQGGDALDFIRERPDLVEKGLRTMGYRLVPTALTYPTSIRGGEKIIVEATWVNRGVGRMTRDAAVSFSLVNGEGKAIATAEGGTLATHEWVKGKEYASHNEAAFEGVPAGEYQLAMTLIDPQSGKRIALPVVGARDDRVYPVGTVRVSPR